MRILKTIPDVLKGVVLMLAGVALLLHTLGILKDFLWYALVAISAYLIFVGFIKIRGVETIKCMIKKKDKDVFHSEEE